MRNYLLRINGLLILLAIVAAGCSEDTGPSQDTHYPSSSADAGFEDQFVFFDGVPTEGVPTCDPIRRCENRVCGEDPLCGGSCGECSQGICTSLGNCSCIDANQSIWKLLDRGADSFNRNFLVEPHSPEQVLSEQGGIEVWLKPQSHKPYAGVLHKGVLPDFSDESYGLQFWGSSGQIALYLRGEAGEKISLISPDPLPLGEWQHVV